MSDFAGLFMAIFIFVGDALAWLAAICFVLWCALQAWTCCCG